jgi:uncharacterized membrane protein
MDEQLIDNWFKGKVITKKQADRMLADLSKAKAESRSNKLIITLSTIGAILLGIGAILFIASNWQKMTDLVKTLTMLVVTLAALFGGYFLKYENKSFPKVGSSLIFLSSLLFGATVILISQIYNLNANHHLLVLLWLIGIIPLVYALASTPIAWLAAALFYLWLGLFFSSSWWFFEDIGRFSLLIFISASVALFSFGGMHYRFEGFHNIARAYRLVSLKVLMLCLFIMTFSYFTKLSDSYLWDWYNKVSESVMPGVLIVVIISLLVAAAGWALNKSKEVAPYEGLLSGLLLMLSLAVFFYPSTNSVYVIIFNIMYPALTLYLIYLGYRREDIKIVNIGMFWLAVFIIAKYFDWFWKLLERSVFFIIGGIILVLGGMYLEKKRREIKTRIENG